MRFLRLLLTALLLAAPAAAVAQTNPNLSYGQVLTAGQWNALFASKQDYLGSPPLLLSGGTMTGALITAPSILSASGFNVPPGTAPSAPNNGDIWETASGIFARINGTTYNLLVPCSLCAATNVTNTFTVQQNIDLSTGTEPVASTGTALEGYGSNGVAVRDELTAFNNAVSGATSVFDGRTSLGTRTSPATVTSGTLLASFEGKGYDTSVWTGTAASFHAYAEGTFSTSSHPGEACVATTPSGGTTTADWLCVHQDGGVTLGSPTGGDEGAGKINVAGAYLVNGASPSITINGTVCTLAGTCTITTASTSIAVGTTTITGGTSGDVEFNNAGVLGEKGVTGTGSVVLAAGPSLTGTITIGGFVQTFPGAAATLAALNLTGQTISGGANVTVFSNGTLTTGTFTPNCGNGPIQTLGSNGFTTFAAPANDGSCDIWMTNGASAAFSGFTGYTTNSNTGEPVTNTNTNVFIIHVERASGVSTFFIKALQ